jgi:hypothetical protein
MRGQSQEIQDEVLKRFDDKVRTEGLPEIPNIQIKATQEKEYER